MSQYSRIKSRFTARAAEIRADHPELESEDVSACLQYARLAVSGETVAHVA